MPRIDAIEYHNQRRRVAVFPDLVGKQGLIHGFSWGWENMALGWEETEQGRLAARERVHVFLQEAGMSGPPISVSLEPTPGRENTIRYLPHDEMNRHLMLQAELFCTGEIPYLEPIHIEGNFVYTQIRDLPLYVKPADCPCAIVYYDDEKGGRLLGLLHAGRDQLDDSLPEQMFYHLKQEIGCNPAHFFIGISPSIAPTNYKIRVQDSHLLRDPERWKRHLVLTDTHIHLDLGARLFESCISAGVPEKNITQYSVDTYLAAARSEGFSHRYATESGKQNGRYLFGAQLF